MKTQTERLFLACFLFHPRSPIIQQNHSKKLPGTLLLWASHHVEVSATGTMAGPNTRSIIAVRRCLVVGLWWVGSWKFFCIFFGVALQVFPNQPTLRKVEERRVFFPPKKVTMGLVFPQKRRPNKNVFQHLSNPPSRGEGVEIFGFRIFH